MPHPGGRPTLYSQKLLEKAATYLNATYPRKAPNGDMEVLPTIEGLAEYLGITRTTIYDWQKDLGKKQFSYIISKILQRQAKILLNNGLGGVFEQPTTKLMLSKHGYIDKSQLDNNHTFENLTDEQREKLNSLLKPRSA